MSHSRKELITLNLILLGVLGLFIAFSADPVIGGAIGFIAMIAAIFFHFFFHYFGWIIPVCAAGLIIINIKAFKAVRSDVISNEILLFFGGIGAFIASRIYDITKESKERIGIIFSASLWIMMIYPLCCFVLYKLDVFQFPAV